MSATHDQKVGNLNYSGLFFEEYCADILIRDHAGFVSALKVEFPFHYQTEATGAVVQGRADIVALASTDSTGSSSQHDILLAIECKKVNPDTKLWVFSKARDDIHRTRQDDPRYLIQIKKGTTSSSYERREIVRTRSSEFSSCAPVCNRGYELRESDGNLNRSGNLRIDDAVTQANRAANAVSAHDLVGAELFDTNWQPACVFPIVLTNSQLEIANFAPSDVDKVTGEIDSSKVQFEPVKWLWFESQLLATENIKFTHRRTSAIEFVEKRYVAIVNPDGLDEFFDRIATIADDYLHR